MEEKVDAHFKKMNSISKKKLFQFFFILGQFLKKLLLRVRKLKINCVRFKAPVFVVEMNH